MSAHKPVQGSETFRVLTALQSAGGCAMPSDAVMTASVAESDPKGRVLRSLRRLEAVFMVRFDAQNMVHLTAIGRAHLVDPCGLLAKRVKQEAIVAPRVAPAFRPLNMSKLMAGGPQRDGMDAHKQIPSLMIAGVRMLPSGEVVE